MSLSETEMASDCLVKICEIQDALDAKEILEAYGLLADLESLILLWDRQTIWVCEKLEELESLCYELHEKFYELRDGLEGWCENPPDV